MSDAVHVTPGSDAPLPRPPEPSTVPKTLGILSIVFAGLFTLYSLLGIASGAAVRTMMPRMVPGRDVQFPSELLQASLEASRRLVPYQQTEAGISLIMSLALLFIGIGLVKYREAARKAAVTWAVMAFPVLGFRAWLRETKMWPIQRDLMHSMQEFMKSQTDGQALPFDIERFTTTFAHGSQFVVLALLAVFPALLLILLNL